MSPLDYKGILLVTLPTLLKLQSKDRNSVSKGMYAVDESRVKGCESGRREKKAKEREKGIEVKNRKYE